MATDRILELHDDIGHCHTEIQSGCFELNILAAKVAYLHPTLAQDIRRISGDIEYHRGRMQGDAAEIVNIQIGDYERQWGNIITTLVNKATKA